jgi:Putative prokaryotic signal transducing protein
MNPKDEKLVTVFATGNHAVIALAKSMLDDADIKYYAKNERSEDLIGIGVVGTGYNPVIGPIELQVLEENAGEAKELLKDLSEGQVEQ